MEGDAYKNRKEDNMGVQIASWQYIDTLCTSGTNYEAFILHGNINKARFYKLGQNY